MTVVLRDEITEKKIRLIKVQKLYEDGNSIRVYFNTEDEKKYGFTSYAFATVISVEQK